MELKINKKYFSEFCNKFKVLQTGRLTQINKSKINYTFGTPMENLENITNYESLEKVINANLGETPEAEKDLALEVENTYRNFLIQKSKINPNPNFIGRYFNNMFHL